MDTGMRDGARARLLLLADSSFPTGAFAHSWGLEWAVRSGWVTDAASLLTWTRDALRFGVAPLSGRAVACAAAMAAPGTESTARKLVRLSDEVASFQPSREAREGEAQLGRSLLRAAADALPSLRRHPAYAAATREAAGHDDRIQHPVAWGFVGAALGIDAAELLQVFLLGTVRQWSQVAMRTVPVGQSDAVAVVGALLEEVTGLARRIARRTRPLASATPGWDAAVLGHGELQARYFRS
ncbi:MAG: hypothetical protein OXC31_07280 [Spirochaetaceae bacterium]|nr:hypothetical protein [Spirochaetaceae bacterium]